MVKVILIGFLISLPVLSCAQNHTIAPGDTIRITHKDIVTTRIIGELGSISDDSLFLARKDSTWSFARSSIHRIDISTGRRTWGGRGAAVGAITGGLLFGVFAMASDESCGPDDNWCMDLFDKSDLFVAGFAMGAIGGTLTGFIIGRLTETHRWKKVPLEVGLEPISLLQAKNHNTSGITLRWRF